MEVAVIEAVKSWPQLWDKQHREYSDKTKTVQMWQRVAEMVGGMDAESGRGMYPDEHGHV